MTNRTTNDSGPQHPETIARGLLIEAGRVLVCRNLAKGYAYLPGGHVEWGEPAAVALARELHEECAMDALVGRCALVTELVADGLHEINLVFHVERRDGEEAVQSREPEIGFEWLDLAAVVDEDLRPTSIRAWIASGGAVEGPKADFLSET